MSSYIYSENRFNRRHIIAIVCAAIICIAIEAASAYHFFFAPQVEIPHGKCVLELPVDPTCKDGGTNMIYVIHESNPYEAVRIKEATCAEYMAATHTQRSTSGTTMVIVCAVGILLAVVGVCFALYYGAYGIKKLFEWLLS